MYSQTATWQNETFSEPTVNNHDVRRPRRTDLRRALLQAELSGRLPEFAALSVQAILALIEGADCAEDYLEMAESAASSERERATVDAIRGARDRLGRSGFAVHARADDEQAELWQRLLFTLADEAI